MALLTVAMATSGGSGTNVQGELSNPVSVPDVTGEVKGDGGRLDQNTESLNVTSLMTSDGESKNDSPPSNESGHSDVKGEVRGALIDQIKKFEQTIQTVEHIPEVLHDVTLECLHVDTLEHLKFFLDPTEDVLTSDNMCKDYRGVAEWAGLQQIFIRYISKVDCSNKISEVISMWIKGEGIQHEATVGNFRKCLIELDRPDVLLEMAVKIAKDAIQWKKRELEIPDEPARPLKDTSWQLTRHDVVTGKPTHYMCCLMYADEDDGMASLITELYRKLVPRAQFFRPQFDLKHGAYEMAATAEVIDTRCNGKVIFLISEYFYASAVCRFVVSYCKHVDTMTEQGNLIPFYLTDNFTHTPRVLIGIHGVKWYRKQSRRHNWRMLTETIIGGKVSETEMEKLKERMTNIIDRNDSRYLVDAPYEADTPSPGEPISVYDPEPEVENSDNPSSRQFNPSDDDQLVQEADSELFSIQPNNRRKKNSLLQAVRRKIDRFFKSNSSSRS